MLSCNPWGATAAERPLSGSLADWPHTLLLAGQRPSITTDPPTGACDPKRTETDPKSSRPRHVKPDVSPAPVFARVKVALLSGRDSVR